MRIASFLGVGCALAASFCKADGLDKLSPGEHDAPIRDVQLHYTVAGKGPLVFVCSPGWGAGSFYLQQGLAPLEKALHAPLYRHAWQRQIFKAARHELV